MKASKTHPFIRAASACCATLVLVCGMAAPASAAPVTPAQAETAVTHSSAATPKTPGRWVTRGGKKYRYNDSGKLLKRYFVVDGKRYFANAKGEVVTKRGWFTRHDGKKAYAGSKGVIQQGVIKHGGKLYYVNKWGLKRSGLFQVGGKWYLTNKGEIKKGWNTYKNRKYYVAGAGHLLTGTQTIKGRTYEFSAKGVLQEEKLTATLNGKKVTAKAEEVLSQIVMAEVGGFRNAEVYKAQAIAAHTYLRHQYAQGNKYPTMPAKAPTSMCKQAVSGVANMYLTYEGKPAFTPYYASSNGKTNPCQDFWKRSYPYLQTVDSSYDTGATGYKATKTFTADQFRAIMDKTYGAGNYTLGSNPAKWIATKKNSAGYVTSVAVGGRTPSVEYFYQTMMGIRSPDFTVKYNKDADSLTFTTKGYGHGVGMSQWGAYFYATKSGYGYARILSHYYPGTTLVK